MFSRHLHWPCAVNIDTTWYPETGKDRTLELVFLAPSHLAPVRSLVTSIARVLRSQISVTRKSLGRGSSASFCTLYFTVVVGRRLPCSPNHICGVRHQPQRLESAVPYGEVTEGQLGKGKGPGHTRALRGGGGLGVTDRVF